MKALIKRMRIFFFGLTKKESEMIVFLNPEVRRELHKIKVDRFHAWMKFRMGRPMTVETRGHIYELAFEWRKCRQMEEARTASKEYNRIAEIYEVPCLSIGNYESAKYST